MGALHRNEPEFVVKAPLAKRLGFFYTFLKGKLPDNGVGVCGRPSGGKRSRKKETIMSTTTNFWELLQQRQDELTKSGRAVADYLVHHADEAQYLSISPLRGNAR